METPKLEAATYRLPPQDTGGLEVHLDADGTHVRFSGDWDLSSAPRLREELDGVNAAAHVIFDFSEMAYIDSSTIRVLVEFKKRSSALHGTTAIYYGSNEKARRTMSISGVGALL